MWEIKYTDKQIKELLNNEYVDKCTWKYISFKKDFKLKVLDLHKKWIYIKEIFEMCWFPDYVVNSKIPINSLNRWKNNLIRKWELEKTKWRKKKERIDKSKMTKDEYIEYLETENAVLKEIKKLIDWDFP